jgi:ubiquinone/menaquinone biosynthesis C-methylase UbiE
VQTTWNYTNLADAYLKRPEYASSAIDKMMALTGVEEGAPVCDVGAGVAHLTLELAARKLLVTAVEPNDAMRENGIQRTEKLSHVTWREGVGEATSCESDAYDLVTFGSSFNVCDRQAALIETKRILHSKGWFACMWNHRDLNDPLQSEIEECIRSQVSEYSYGTRREDQTIPIEASGLFGEVHKIEGTVLHQQSIEDCIEAWRSHATLQRQAGEAFPAVVHAIESIVHATGTDMIEIPYTTRIWAARLLE